MRSVIKWNYFTCFLLRLGLQLGEGKCSEVQEPRKKVITLDSAKNKVIIGVIYNYWEEKGDVEQKNILRLAKDLIIQDIEENNAKYLSLEYHYSDIIKIIKENDICKLKSGEEIRESLEEYMEFPDCILKNEDDINGNIRILDMADELYFCSCNYSLPDCMGSPRRFHVVYCLPGSDIINVLRFYPVNENDETHIVDEIIGRRKTITEEVYKNIFSTLSTSELYHKRRYPMTKDIYFRRPYYAGSYHVLVSIDAGNVVFNVNGISDGSN